MKPCKRGDLWTVDSAHLIRLVLWRGTAGEELAYVGALCSARPLHRAIACAIGFLQVNHKALHAFALMGANAEAQRISHWDEPSGPLAGEIDGRIGPILPTLGCGGVAGMSVNSRHACSVGSPSACGLLQMHSAPQKSLGMGLVHPR